jgi:pilus assembly protein CpaB
MKGSRAVMLLLLSLVAGVAAMVLAARWLHAQGGQPTGPQVVVATRDVDLGQPLNGSMVQLVSWPADSVPQGAFLSLESIEGRVLRTQLQKGEPVLEAKLAPAGTKGGLSALIGEGQRAITVKVNEVFGVAGFALPGNFVDVLVNTQDDRDRPGFEDRARAHPRTRRCTGSEPRRYEAARRECRHARSHARAG